MIAPPQALLDRRSEPDARAVLEDWYSAHDERVLFAAMARYAQGFRSADDAAAADDAVADDDDDAADDDDDDADAADDDAADAADDDDDDDDAAADAAADDADAADDASIEKRNQFWRGAEMKEGLLLVKFAGWYGRGLVRVGWVRRVSGDEYEMLPGAVSVWRRGAPLTPLDQLAALGPKKHKHHAVDPSLVVEPLHRWSGVRVLYCHEAAWATDCPSLVRPAGWVER
jgi:hypothetical protein